MPESPLAQWMRSLGIAQPTESLPPAPPMSAMQRWSDPAQASVMESSSDQLARKVMDALQNGMFKDLAMGATTNVPGQPYLSKPLAELIVPAPELGVGQYRYIPQVIDRIKKALEIGQTRNVQWNPRDPRLLVAAGGDENLLRQVRSLNAAMTPHTDVLRSTAEAKMANAMQLEGSPLMKQQLREAGVTMVGSKAGNARRAVRGEPLSGPKVNLMDEWWQGGDVGVPDVHWLDLLGVAGKSPDIMKQMKGLRALIYQVEGIGRGMPVRKLSNEALAQRAMSATPNAFREIAPELSPNLAFAEGWEGARAIKGLPHYGGWLDMLESVGMLEPGAFKSAPANRLAAELLWKRAPEHARQQLGRLRLK